MAKEQPEYSAITTSYVDGDLKQPGQRFTSEGIPGLTWKPENEAAERACVKADKARDAGDLALAAAKVKADPELPAKYAAAVARYETAEFRVAELEEDLAAVKAAVDADDAPADELPAEESASAE